VRIEYVELFIRILIILVVLNLGLNFCVNFSSAEEEQGLKLRAELLNLSSVKEEMISAGMGVSRVDDLITEGFLYFNNKNYDKTREIIASVYELRRTAFNAQNELGLVNQLYLSVVEENISLGDISKTKLEWELEQSQREFNKENYEGSLEILARIKKALLESISNKYNYLNNSLSGLEERTTLLELSKARIITLKTLLSEALRTGKLGELEILEQEVKSLNKSLAYYEEVRLAIPNLEDRNLSTQRIRDGLRSAELDLNFAEYESGLNKLESLEKLIQDALRLEKEITELEGTITNEQAGLGVSFEEAKNILKQAKHELVIGDYESAEQKLISARTSYESSKAEVLVKKVGLKSFGISLREFVKENRSYILLVILIISLVLKLTSGLWVKSIRRRKITRLEKELRISKRMVQDLQKDYFVHRKMSRESYDEAYEALQERIMRLKERLSLLNKKVNKEEGITGMSTKEKETKALQGK